MDLLGSGSVGLTITRRSADIGQALRTDTCDLCVGPGGVTGAGLRSRVLLSESFVVAARADHPLASTSLSMDAYLGARHMQIAPDGRPGGPIDGLLASRGLRRDVVLKVGHFVSAPFVLASTDLLLTAPEGLVLTAQTHVPLAVWPCPFEAPTVKARMYWHEKHQRAADHVWLRSFIARVTDAWLATASPPG